MCQAFKASGWAETFAWKLIGSRMAQGCRLVPSQPSQSHAVEKDKGQFGFSPQNCVKGCLNLLPHPASHHGAQVQEWLNQVGSGHLDTTSGGSGSTFPQVPARQ